MELAIAALAALSIALILIAVILNRQVEQAHAILDQSRCLRLAQAREIESLRGKAQALDLQLQLKRKAPKRTAIDPVEAKLRLVQAINEVFKNG